MHIVDVVMKIENICPLSLAQFEFNGIIRNFNSRKIVKKLGFTLGFSKNSINKAIAREIDMLVVHNAPESLSDLKDDYYKEIIDRIDKSSLSIYRMHLPLDFAIGGIIDQLCKLMQFKAKPADLMYGKHVIRGGVYVAKEKLSLQSVLKRVQLLNPSTIRIVKSKKKEITNIAIASGDGCKPEFLLQLRPDVFICGLLNQESIRIAQDLDIALIEATSYATENGPLKEFVTEKKKYFQGMEVSFIDVKNNVKSYNVSNNFINL